MKKPWIGVQYWESPVFMHWPVSYDTLRPFVPEPFKLDTFNSKAWVSIVVFRSPHSRLRWGSGLFSLGSLWQVNVRTYVRFYEEPAVYFLAIYTDSKPQVWGANWLLSLPYQHASFDITRSVGRVSYQMEQANRNQSARFLADIFPSSGSNFFPGNHSLEHWLVERYHVYFVKGKRIVKATISHTPWKLGEARSDIICNDLIDFVPEVHDNEPLVHTATSQTSYLYPFQITGRYLR